MMDDRYFMSEALKLAKECADSGEVPVGAVVVRNGEIVGRGKNSRESEKNALAHAELQAINDACRTLGGWRLWDCTLYVTLEPCPMCTGAIINSRIQRVVFGAFDQKAGSCSSVINLFSLPYNHSPLTESGFMQEECSAVLRDFFKKVRSGEKKVPVNPKWKNNSQK